MYFISFFIWPRTHLIKKVFVTRIEAPCPVLQTQKVCFVKTRSFDESCIFFVMSVVSSPTFSSEFRLRQAEYIDLFQLNDMQFWIKILWVANYFLLRYHFFTVSHMAWLYLVKLHMAMFKIKVLYISCPLHTVQVCTT